MKKLFLIILCGFLPTLLTGTVYADGEVAISIGALQLPATYGSLKEELIIGALALMIIGGIVVTVSEIILAVAYYKGKR